MLTQRDIDHRRMGGRQGAVRAEHVMARFSIGRTATYRHLRRAFMGPSTLRRHRLLYQRRRAC